MRRLQSVHTDVDQRSATLQVLAAEHPPVRDSAPPEGPHASENDAAQLAFVDGPLDELHLGVVAVLKTDDQAAAIPLRRVQHPLALARVHGERLFHDHVCAGIEGRD